MNIILKKLTLINFKGATNCTIEFSPTLTKIYGANKSGKTTIADAFRWVLFGKNTEGKAVFGIETKNAAGEILPIAEHEVQAVLDVDGKEVNLRRVYVTKWKTEDNVKRISAHVTNYYINGNKLTEKEYKEYIDTLCSESLFMSITDPTYFTSLSAEQQRTLLTRMVGEVSLEDIAKGNDEFERILELMHGDTIERFVEQLSYKKSEVKKELETIPIRINEHETEIASYSAEDMHSEDELANIDKQIAAIDEQIVDKSKVEDDKFAKLQTKRQEINSLKKQYEDEEARIKREYDTEVRELQYNKEAATQQINNLQNKQKVLVANKQNASEYLQDYTKQLAQKETAWKEQCEAFRKRWNDAKSEQFAYDDNSEAFVCPTCHRRLDTDDIEATVKKMQESWNTTHAKVMQTLQSEAQMMKERYENARKRDEEQRLNCENIVANNDTLIKQVEEELREVKLDLEALNARSIMPIADRYKADTLLQQLKAAIEDKESELQRESATPTSADTDIVDKLKQDKETLQKQRDEIRDILNKKNIIAQKRTRIAELEKQESALNQQLSELEGVEYNAQKLIEANITELEKKVNGLFSLVTFEMFEHKLNGALKTKCECLVGGIPYSDLNRADKINAGIDIINAICRFKNVCAPCFIDNAESINNVLAMQGQSIHLIVSTDKELVIQNNNSLF